MIDANGWAALFGGASAAVAAGALWYSRFDAKRSATFEHLREIERANAVWLAKGKEGTYDTLADAVVSRRTFTEDEEALAGYLGALELLAFAIRYRAVDVRMSKAFVRNMLTKPFRDYVRVLQRACGDREVWKYFGRLCRDELKPLPPFVSWRHVDD